MEGEPQGSVEGQSSKNMSKLAIIRHGDYGQDEKINKYGRRQMEWMGERLQQELTDGEVALILSSTAPRALDSAEVLSKILGIPVEQHPKLWSDNNHFMRLQSVLALVQSLKTLTDLGILITHMEYTDTLPGLIGARDLGLDLPPYSIERGQGVLINYLSRDVQFLGL